MGADTVDFDVVVIGGGPAGSTMASYLARAGVRCAVFERELFPRPHVGESLVPACNRVFGELGLFDDMESAGFPHKLGAVWTANERAPVYSHGWDELLPNTVKLDGEAVAGAADVAFSERPQEGVDRPYTYHVDRSKFDLLLLKHAQKLGASVYSGVAVRGVDFTEGAPVRVRYSLGPKEEAVTAKMVVDATGRRTLLGNQLGWKRLDPVFDQYALHTWFEDYDRTQLAPGPDREDYIYVHFLPLTNSWIWQIPITDRITSIGVVTQKKNFAKKRESREEFFWECLSSRPKLEQALRKAKQLKPLTDEGDYSYAMSNICGERVMLIGDAARFVDPIFSSGVSIAMNSARIGSEDILRALQTGDFSRAAFSNYENILRRGTKNWYTFISLYYRLNVLFTQFISDPRHRLDVLKLLQGDMYDEDEPAVLQKMRELVQTVEQQPNHPWHKLLGELTADAFRPSF